MTERAEPRASRLEELYERHAADAVRLAFLVTADRELARDIAQDAFVRVAGRFRHLRFPDAFDVYLRRTVVNLCMSHFRHRRVEREYLTREAGRPERPAEPPELGARDELRRALERLPAHQRAAIVLRYYSCSATTRTCPRTRSPRRCVARSRRLGRWCRGAWRPFGRS